MNVKGDKISDPSKVFWGDNYPKHYNILSNSTISVLENKIEGMFCEVGVRRGYGTYVMMEQIAKYKIKKNVLGIDPYGNIPYKRKDGYDVVISNYDNTLRNFFLKNVYEFAEKNGYCNYSFFNMTDSKFFELFSNGVPFYDDSKEIILNSYCLVHLDGPHNTEEVSKELDFFCPKVSLNGIIIIDDIDVMNKDTINKKFMDYGFKVHEEFQQKIISYKRINETKN